MQRLQKEIQCLHEHDFPKLKNTAWQVAVCFLHYSYRKKRRFLNAVEQGTGDNAEIVLVHVSQNKARYEQRQI
jgi:hypothetical protein